MKNRIIPISAPANKRRIFLRDLRVSAWNESRRKHPFTQQVLQKIGNAQAGAEYAGRDGCAAKIVREDALADESREPAQENTQRDEECESVSPLPGLRWSSCHCAHEESDHTNFRSGKQKANISPRSPRLRLE